MEWDAIGAIGEIIGAIAVVGTLAYLARQVKTQNTATETVMYDNLISSWGVPLSMLVENAEVARIWRVGLHEPDALSDDEATQFSALFRLVINSVFKLHRLFERGVVTEAEWKLLASQAADIYDSPGGKLFAEGHPTFRELTEKILSEKMEVRSIDYFLGRCN